MIYRAIGVMSGSSLDGLDLAFVEFEESGNQWKYNIQHAECYAFPPEWKKKLTEAHTLNAFDFCRLHTDLGYFIGQKINEFIDTHQLHHKVQLIASHGHTVFHAPKEKMTAQIGDGAAIAATTGINVVSDLRAMDIALGGQGAPIVPMGERLLLNEYELFLNLGGIANLSFNADKYIAFDVCAANRVLNMLSELVGKAYDEDGKIAASGEIDHPLIQQLNALDYYQQSYPKSLANSFGTDTVYEIIQKAAIPVEDALRTYTEHICLQISNAVESALPDQLSERKMLVTGGGAFNTFLIERLQQHLQFQNVEVVVPDEKLVQYKEALIMALLGVLRWREQNTVLSSVTGAARSSIGGAVWIGQEA